MARIFTVPTILRRPDILNLIIRSVSNVGWGYTLLSSVKGTNPIKLVIRDGTRKESLLIYIWNISQGGKTRNPDEYRIQMKGTGLEISPNFKTLLLGWYNEEQLFVAFNAQKHRTFGYSPSVQVNIKTLHEAANNGIAFQTKKLKEGEEIVIAFKPYHLIEYILYLFRQYHSQAKVAISPEESAVMQTHLTTAIPAADLNRIPQERRTAVRVINQKIRNSKFRTDVWNLYEGKCALCGLQANLTEAAHIIAVASDGNDNPDNGILMCRNHHKAYDIGLLAVSEDYTILISSEMVARLGADHQDNKLSDFITLSRIGQKIHLPAIPQHYPNKEYLKENRESKGL